MYHANNGKQPLVARASECMTLHLGPHLAAVGASQRWEYHHTSCTAGAALNIVSCSDDNAGDDDGDINMVVAMVTSIMTDKVSKVCIEMQSHVF